MGVHCVIVGWGGLALGHDLHICLARLQTASPALPSCHATRFAASGRWERRQTKPLHCRAALLQHTLLLTPHPGVVAYEPP